jgi:hypothetical protein
MSQPELVKKIVHVLNEVGVDYMLTGSVASSMQGEPRSSHDIDIVVKLLPIQVKKLVAALPEDEFYISEEAVSEAVKRLSMFNILPLKESEKIDVWLLKDEAYDLIRFSRKYATEALGTRIKLSKPEDTILYKLKWALMSGGSEKQYRDALRVFEVQYRNIDVEYMDKWAKFLGVVELLERIRREAIPLK